MKENEYWENYYKKHAAPVVPSQFGTFACAEMQQDATVLEVGCGNGRDALFFAQYGFNTIGVDSSQEAIAFCHAVARQNGLPDSFLCVDVREMKNALDFSGHKADAPVSVYSRFFLHAITDEEETLFLEFVKDTLSQYGGNLFVEFRTDRDRELYKVTERHFRRFIKSFDFINRATRSGLLVKYFTEGFGFAKYAEEDAHVARMILTL